MTEQELAEIESRANAASVEPWILCSETYYDGGVELAYRHIDKAGIYGKSNYPLSTQKGQQEAINLEFCCRARKDVPALVKEIHRLQGLLAVSHD